MYVHVCVYDNDNAHLRGARADGLSSLLVYLFSFSAAPLVSRARSLLRPLFAASLLVSSRCVFLLLLLLSSSLFAVPLVSCPTRALTRVYISNLVDSGLLFPSRFAATAAAVTSLACLADHRTRPREPF